MHGACRSSHEIASGHFARYLTGTHGHIGPVVPQRDKPATGVDVVAADVQPAFCGRMPFKAVQFHDEAKYRVQIVEVRRPRAQPGPHLPLRRRKAVSVLYVPAVPAFQGRQDPLDDVLSADMISARQRSRLRSPAA